MTVIFQNLIAKFQVASKGFGTPWKIQTLTAAHTLNFDFQSAKPKPSVNI